MVKITAGLVRRAVKLDWKYEVRNFLIHGAKVWNYFEFRMFNFEFFE
jgi:hypothetical protein